MNETTGNEMAAMVSRTERLVSALTDAFVGSAEAAAEKFELASQVARVKQRLEAVGNVLEMLGTQKQVILERQAEATGALKAMYAKQIEVYEQQEIAILAKIGVGEAQAKAALTVVDEAPVYTRQGRAFKRAELATNGVS